MIGRRIGRSYVAHSNMTSADISADRRPTIGRSSADCQKPKTVGRWKKNYNKVVIIYFMSADEKRAKIWHFIGRSSADKSADCRPIVGGVNVIAVLLLKCKTQINYLIFGRESWFFCYRLLAICLFLFEGVFSSSGCLGKAALFEPRCQKTGLRGIWPGPTQTGLYSHRRWLEA